MALHGKTAIVTGGNSGIGKAIALALAEQGANIVIDFIANEQATEDLEKQIVALGDKAIGVDADVSKVADLQQLMAAAVQAFGRIDIMVNNAGVETRTSVLDTTEQQYEKVLEINLKSAFFGTQLAAKQMITQGEEAGSSTSPRCTRTGPCPATSRTACPRAGCGCSPARREWSSLPTTSWWSGWGRVPSPRPSTSPP